MSEHPRDDEDLQSFLDGDSALSRRYKDASDEQPPAKVDAAILAASEWAVGAGPGRGGQRSAPERPGGAVRGGSKWWDKLFSRWSVPLATAAVVVVAATLTLMIERDPELERIERDYDSVALNAPDKRAEEAEQTQTMAGQSDTVDADQPAPAASSRPASAIVKSEAAGAENDSKPARSTAPERLAFRPVQEDDAVAAANAVARKQAADRKEAAGATGRQETPAEPVLGEFAGNVAPPAAEPARSSELESKLVDNAVPVERRREADASRVDADVATEEAAAPVAAPTQAFSPAPATAVETEPADVIGDRDGATAPSGMSSARVPAPANSDTRSAARDPEQWIADIEEQLALGNRELARAAVRNFRERYPDYKLPDALAELLPADESGTGASGMEDQ